MNRPPGQPSARPAWLAALAGRPAWPNCCSAWLAALAGHPGWPPRWPASLAALATSVRIFAENIWMKITNNKNTPCTETNQEISPFLVVMYICEIDNHTDDINHQLHVSISGNVNADEMNINFSIS